jgi:hypothetical protein
MINPLERNRRLGSKQSAERLADDILPEVTAGTCCLLEEDSGFGSIEPSVEEHARARKRSPCNGDGLRYLPPPTVKSDVAFLVPLTAYIHTYHHSHSIYNCYSTQDFQLQLTNRIIRHNTQSHNRKRDCSDWECVIRGSLVFGHSDQRKACCLAWTRNL